MSRFLHLRPHYNFDFLYQGCYSSSGGTIEQVDLLAKQYCESILVRKTEEFNQVQEGQPITFFNPQTDHIQEEDIFNEYDEVVTRSDVTVLVTSENILLAEQNSLINYLLPIILRPKLQERAVLHLHIGEYHKHSMPSKLRLFHRVNISRDDATWESNANIMAIFSTIWRKTVKNVANFIGLEGIDDEVITLSRLQETGDSLEFCLDEISHEILEIGAFNNWVKKYKFSNRLMADVYQSQKSTKTQLLTLIPILELRRYSSYTEDEKKSLDVALNELHDGSYRWRNPLDSHLYKFHKYSTAILLARFTSNIPAHDIRQLKLEEEIEKEFLNEWNFGGNGMIRIWDISQEAQNIMFNCIILAKDNVTLNSIASHMELFMKTTQDNRLSVQERESGSVLKFTPVEYCDNLIVKQLFLDESFLSYIDFPGNDATKFEYLVSGRLSEDTGKENEEIRNLQEEEINLQHRLNELRQRREELNQRQEELRLQQEVFSGTLSEESAETRNENEEIRSLDEEEINLQHRLNEFRERREELDQRQEELRFEQELYAREELAQGYLELRDMKGIQLRGGASICPTRGH